MSLEQDAFVALYDGLNEHTKKPVLYKLLEELPLDDILLNAVTSKKIKVLVAPRISCDIFKELFMRSNNFRWILECYLNSVFITDMLLYSKCKKWKYLVSLYDGQVALTTLDEMQYLPVECEKIPISFTTAAVVNPDRLFKFWNTSLTEWYCY
jgi:hypothetical protein